MKKRRASAESQLHAIREEGNGNVHGAVFLNDLSDVGNGGLPERKEKSADENALGNVEMGGAHRSS